MKTLCRPSLDRALLLCWLLLSLLLLAPAASQAQTVTRPDLYLLTISVGQYQHPDIPDLLYADDDARGLRAWAQTQNGKLYNTVHVEALTDGQATRTAIIDKLVTFFRDAQPSDQLILYLSGHGVVSEERGTWHFLPVEANPHALEATGLEQDDILGKLENPRRPHKRVLVLTDTCQAGALAGALPASAGISSSLSSMSSSPSPSGSSSASPSGSSSASPTRGLVLSSDMQLSSRQIEDKTSLWLVFGAGTASDKAEEGPQYKLPTDDGASKGHGVFTWAMLRALASREADTDGSGIITLSEFLQFVSREVAKATVNREVSKATQSRQIPVMSGRFMDVGLGWAPGSVEVCDGRDNDLDGLIDEGQDTNGDGQISLDESFDKDGNKTADCLEDERCNGKDDNGNGLIDEGFDLDGDGYLAQSCGTVLGRDCNDHELSIHPDQEDWGNTRDDDCDGLTDEDDFDRNFNHRPDVLEKHLFGTRLVQATSLGLGLVLLGGTAFSLQQVQAMERLPEGSIKTDYQVVVEETQRYRSLRSTALGLSAGSVAFLGVSLKFSFDGHELRARLPEKWLSPKREVTAKTAGTAGGVR